MIASLSSRPFSARPHRLLPVLLPALLLACLLPAVASAQILISELMADPASDWDGDGEYNFRADEWVEVLNTGTVAVDLSAYWLRDETGDDVHLNLVGLLEPGQVAVFFGSQAVAWQQTSGSGSGGLSLNNSGDTVVLLRTMPGSEDPDNPELEIADSVTYSAHEAEDDRSCGLAPDHASWLLFDALNPYSGDQEPVGTGCGPSPGVPNICDPLPADQLSFGSLKALYN